MRFFALLKKELRECMPWTLLAGVGYLLIGGFFLQLAFDMKFGRYLHFSPGSTVSSYTLIKSSSLSSCGIWLAVISIALGLALGIRQFWMPQFTGTWGITLHRSVKRQTILWGKISAAVISFVITVCLLWSIFFRYSQRPGLLPIPPINRYFAEGLIFIAVGFVTYLGTVLAGLSKAKWYTTKIFGLAFAAMIFIATGLQYRIVTAFAVLLIASLFLLAQIVYTFLNREF